MPAIERYAQGAPCWVDLSTSDETAALAFYGALFGWRDDPADMGDGQYYHMLKLGPAHVGAIYQQQPEEVDQGIPSHWNTYINVVDVEGVTRNVGELGGTVLAEPFEVLDSGRMSVIADPTGAIVALWQALSHRGSGVRGEPGAVAWNELITTNPESAAAFFRDLLGVQPATMSGPGDVPYTLLRVNGQDAAGIMPIAPQMGDMPPNWFVYFAVEDCDASAAQAKSLGATVLAEPMDTPPGRFAIVQDPQGAVFGVIRLSGEM